MWYKLYLLTGFIFLAVSLYKLKQSIDFIRKGERVIGTVTSLQENDGAYSPLFTIKTEKDGEIIYDHPSATSPSAWDIGEEAVFLYEPGNPRSATMVGYFWLFSWAIAFMVVAIPLIIVGAGYYLLRPLTRLPQESYTGRENGGSW